MDELIGAVRELKTHINAIETIKQRKTSPYSDAANVSETVLQTMEQHLDRLFVRVVRLATDPYYHAKYTPQAIQQVAESAIRAFMQHRGIF